MKLYNLPEITPGLFAVGVKDWNRRLFDALIPLPQGTTYNSYLIKGKEKTAVVDTVNPGFEAEWLDRIGLVTGVETIDYIVMNHAEPDHAGSIPVIMAANKKAVLVTSEKGAKMAQVYYRVPAERLKPVKDGETLPLGGKTLRFIEAPWLHWPETMFTHVVEDRVLLPCDFLGAHSAFGTYDDEVEDLPSLAKKYFGEIMMPFKAMGVKALEKIKNLDIRFIGPSHGPIYRNPPRIIDAYTKWTAGETKEKAIAVYATMWGHTETMVKTAVETLLAAGVETCLYNLTVADLGDIAKDLVDARAIVFGMPTVLGGMHPVAIHAAHLVKALKPPLRYGVVLSSYGWNGGALKQAAEVLAPTKIEVTGALEINGPPTDDDLKKIVELGHALARKIKG